MEYKDVQLSFLERLFRGMVQRYNGEMYSLAPEQNWWVTSGWETG